ncbi:MAG TPA: glycosyltransferase [Opitutaceae bacterium]|nr:glycosyltransferase [Opitutaceae bacterium]
MHRLSVIVPAFNEERLLAGSLRNLRSCCAPLAERGWAAELIVCDNNSTDRTPDIARAEGAAVVFEPFNQIARARNAGAAAARGDWLLFVDADSFPTPELIADAVGAMESGRYLAGGAALEMEGIGRIGRVFLAGWNLTSRITRWFAGSFVFVEAAAFRQVGGFDERYFAGEEIDLSRRLKRLARKSGRRLVVLHRHPMPTSNRKLHLYNHWVRLRVLAHFFLRGGRMTRREGCEMWYDGRR